MPPTTSSARWIQGSVYQAGGSLAPMFNNVKAYMLSSIHGRDSQEKHNALVHQLTEISDRVGGCFLYDHLLFLTFRDTRATTQPDYSKEHTGVQEMTISKRTNLLRQRIKQLNDDLMVVFDKVLELLDTR